MSAEREDIGHGVLMERVITEDGRWVGIFEEHAGNGGRCLGAAMFDVEDNPFSSGPKWRVESWDPLTLSPSLLCRICGNHGFIREGKWVPA